MSTATAHRADDSAGAASGAMLDLLIVIVNFRTPALTIQCLESLRADAESMPGLFVVVADNCSGDDSVSRIGTAIETGGWSRWCKLAALPRNGGFAWGNNRGIEAAPKARYTLLLNSDTIVHAGALAHCLKVMEEDESIGVMSCKLLNADGSVQNVARKFPSPLRLFVSALALPWKFPKLFGWGDTDDTSWDRGTVRRDVEWLGGAFLFCRGSLLDRIGGLSDDFFFYGEDIEFSYRVWKAGKRCHYDPRVAITHLGGSSSDPARMPKAAKSVHHWRGRYTVIRKCYGRLAEAFVRGVDIAAYASRAAWRRVKLGKDHPKTVEQREILQTIFATRKPA